ncbi:MAG: hypothetical protein QW717_04030 [Candidatus Bathyarchaeia archaeon]
MSEKISSVKSFALRTNLIVAIIAIISLATAVGTNYRAQSLLVVIAAAIVLTVVATVIRVKMAADIWDCGKAIIQGTWFWMSFSLSYLIMTGSPYFGMPAVSVAVNIIIGIVILVIGVFTLVKTKKETNVMLSI